MHKDSSCFQLDEKYTIFEYGDSETNIVFIINAFGVDSEYWKNFISFLAPTHKCILWNYNLERESSTHHTRATLEDHLSSISCILRKYSKVKNLHIVGWCTGAELASQLAVKVRAIGISSLTLLNGAFYSLDRGKQTPFVKNTTMLAKQVAKHPLRAQLYLDILTKNDNSETSHLQVRNNEIKKLVDLPFRDKESLIEYSYILDDFTSWPHIECEKILAPTLLLTGKNDVMAEPQLSVSAAQIIPNSRIINYDGQDHYLSFSSNTAWTEILNHINQYSV